MSALPNISSAQSLTGCEPHRIPSHVFESDVPIVLEGLVAEWPAVRACSQSLASATSYLSGLWSDKPVTVIVGAPEIKGRFFYNEDCTGFNFARGGAPLPLVFQKLAEQPDDERAQSIYVGCSSLQHGFPGFRQHNDLTVPGDDVAVNAWLGNRSRISAHFDFPDNIACVVAGQRRFTLFPPDQVGNLYIGPLDVTPAGQAISLVDFADPDFDRFPRFETALQAAVTCELGPGDAIFIPSMWWHHVESLSSFNMLVNYWWCSTPEVMGAPLDAILHAILSIREIPKPQRDLWKGLFDHYVFSADDSVAEHIPEAGRGCLAPLDDAAARKLRSYLASRFQQ